jgi:type I site-specific restriction endonuclease
MPRRDASGSLPPRGASSIIAPAYPTAQGGGQTVLGEADTRAKLIDPGLHARGWTEDLIRREETAGAIEIVDGRHRRQARARVNYTLRVRVNPDTQPVAVTDLRARYEQGVGFSLESPAARPLITRYARGEATRRYYQDAAIRAVLEKVARGQRRALLSLATGAGKTFIAVNLLRRIADAGQLHRALFVCDRDELRSQALGAFQAGLHAHRPSLPCLRSFGCRAEEHCCDAL